MDKEKLIEGVFKFKGKNIVVVGDVALDKYTYGRVERVNPENPVAHLLKVEREEFKIGCAGNAALNAAMLGANVMLCSVTGKDNNSVIIGELCEKNLIKFLDIKNGETLVKERAIETSYNHCLLRSDYGESSLEPISLEIEQELIKSIDLTKCDVLILSDYNKYIFSGGFASKLIDLARKNNVPVVVDPKPANVNSFKHASILCPNLKEAREIIKEDGLSKEELARKLHLLLGIDYSIVKCGADGLACFDGVSYLHMKTKAREVSDVTGAGDTVCSALALAMASGLSIPEAAMLANYAAGVVVEKPGTASCTNEELIERISRNI